MLQSPEISGVQGMCLNFGFYLVAKLGCLRIPAGLLLGEYESAIKANFISSACSWYQFQGGNLVLEQSEQLLRLPSGSGKIVSRKTIFDRDLGLL